MRGSTRTAVALGVLATALVAAPLAAWQAAESPGVGPSRTLVLRGVNVVDGRDGIPRLDVSIVVQDGRIVRVGPGLAAPTGARELDLAGYWVVPGLVDAHSHMNTLAAARRALESGVTTVRTAGVGGYADVAIRDAVREGRLAGPDILATGVYVTPDIEDGALADPRLHPFLSRPVQSAEDLRLLVKVNADHGVDWIKTRGTERAGLPQTDPREQVYSQSQLRAVVDAARESGLRVAAHAHGDEGVRAAVLAGVATIEHGTYASEETLRLMKERGTWLVPTLSSVLSFGQAGDYADPALYLRGQHMAPRRVEMVRRAYALKIPIVVGVDTDYGAQSTARVSRAVTFMMEELAFDPLYALQAATSRSAELLGLGDRIGAVRDGFEADLLVIDRNPLQHPRALQDPLVIVSNGQVVVNRLPFGKSN